MKQRILSISLLTLLLYGVVVAGGFSKLPSSARAVALGGSLVSFADDPNLVFYNPAGIASLKTLSIGSSYTQLFTGVSDDNLGYVTASAVANLGFVGNLGVGIKSFSSNYWKENELVGSYAQQLFDFLSVGGSVKLLQWSSPAPSGRLAVPEEGLSNVTLAFDIGAQSQITDIFPENDLRVGIFFGNLNRPSIAKNASPDAKLDLTMVAGATYISRVYDYAVTFHFKAEGEVKRLGIGTEIIAVKTSLLGEPIQMLLRVGGGAAPSPAKQGDINGGFGVTVAGFTFDYAFAYQTELLYISGSHYLSLRYSF
ncbi:MAG: hypothetical protein HY276_03365 [Ignavibacteriales bacterium]|nr:hypothetical protein [Ignavibacteriales bacterium]MBI3787274.1 hypothetical protein [Ignavibacteriales bacterium]